MMGELLRAALWAVRRRRDGEGGLRCEDLWWNEMLLISMEESLMLYFSAYIYDIDDRKCLSWVLCLVAHVLLSQGNLAH